LERFERLVAGIDTTLDKGQHLRLQRHRNGHAAAQHQTGNVLGAVGDLVLYTQQFQQIRARHRQEQTLGQVLSNILLELVSLALQLSHLFLDLLDPLPVLRRHRLEQWYQVSGTFVGLGHVLLHRANGRTPEQADEWIDWHREYPGFRRRQVYG